MILTREDVLNYALSFPGAYQDAPFHDENWQLVRLRETGKTFVLTYEREGHIWVNVKVRPEWRDLFRKAYTSVIPGYHVNKEHWNTVILDGSVPDDDVRMMIAESYDLVSDSPSKRIYEAVKKIPAGHVATYADIARLAGNPGMCRAVGNALHKNPDPKGIPCFRVVNSQGQLSGAFAFGGPDEQARKLREDGIEVVNGRVDLKRFRVQIEEDIEGKAFIIS